MGNHHHEPFRSEARQKDCQQQGRGQLLVLPAKTEKEKSAHHHFRSDVKTLSEVLSNPSLCCKHSRRVRSSQVRGSGESQLQGHRMGSHRKQPPTSALPHSQNHALRGNSGPGLHVCYDPINVGVPPWQLSQAGARFL